MFPRPGPLMMDPDLPNLLKAQTLSPYGNRHPQHALVILEPVASHPGRLLGELNVVEKHEDVTEHGLGEEAGIRCEIRLCRCSIHLGILLQAADRGPAGAARRLSAGWTLCGHPPGLAGELRQGRRKNHYRLRFSPEIGLSGGP